MKLSARTLTLLDNYSKVSDNLLIEKNSNKIQTISLLRDVYSTTWIDEKFDNEVRILDLKGFLKLYKQFNELDIIKVDSEYIHFKNEDVKFKQSMCRKDLLMLPTRSIEMPKKGNYKLKLSKAIMNFVIKFGQSYNSHMNIVADGKTLKLCLDYWHNKDEVMEFDLGKTKDVYKAQFHISNLRMLLPLDYEVRINSKFLCEFYNEDENIFSYIALTPKSEFPEYSKKH